MYNASPPLPLADPTAIVGVSLAGDADVIADEVASLILHDAVMEYERALTAAFTAGADERRRRRDDIAKLLEVSIVLILSLWREQLPMAPTSPPSSAQAPS